MSVAAQALLDETAEPGVTVRAKGQHDADVCNFDSLNDNRYSTRFAN